MRYFISIILLLTLFVMIGIHIKPASADSFDSYRKVIDNYKDYAFDQREQTIKELEKLKTNDIEKYYLLGMLQVIQGMNKMVSIAQSAAQKPEIEEVLQDSSVQKYFRSAENNYDKVESLRPGYKYIYCKYAELYYFSMDEKGLKKITIAVGKADKNERTDQCKGVIESTGEEYAARGKLNISRAIFSAAIENWKPYPQYMVESMGDIENVLGNSAQAKKWWKRCVKEAESEERKSRCKGKLL